MRYYDKLVKTHAELEMKKESATCEKMISALQKEITAIEETIWQYEVEMREDSFNL